MPERPCKMSKILQETERQPQTRDERCPQCLFNSLPRNPNGRPLMLKKTNLPPLSIRPIFWSAPYSPSPIFPDAFRTHALTSRRPSSGTDVTPATKIVPLGHPEGVPPHLFWLPGGEIGLQRLTHLCLQKLARALYLGTSAQKETFLTDVPECWDSLIGSVRSILLAITACGRVPTQYCHWHALNRQPKVQRAKSV